MTLSASELLVEMLIREGLEYAIGIPGHGNLPLVDALRRRRDQITVIMPRHEQAAVHMADGYYRAIGKPLAVYTSIGAGASNTIIGLATAYVDSIPLLLLIGDTHTYMRGVGVLQEVERQRWSDLYRAMEPVVKRSWHIDQARQLPRAVSQAFNAMHSGRPGPTLITLPMDVQAQSIEEDALVDPLLRRAHDRPAGDPNALSNAADLLLSAKRLVIVCGGGVILSRAEQALRALAEHLGCAVVSTMQGKSAFPEDHPLYAWHMGTNATSCGNHMTRSADVLLAVGVRFADKATCSYKPGEAFSIPPSKLIHIDIDPAEIGKNYPVTVGVVADAKSALLALLALVQQRSAPRDWRSAAYTQEIAAQVSAWKASYHRQSESEGAPPTMGRVLRDLRALLPEDALVLTSSGNIQAQAYQEMAFTRSRTYLSAGGFSTMGWAYPAALGAKLALADRPVLALVGDGDFLMTIQELATAVQYNIAAVAVVFNNQGWQAIRDLQQIAFTDEANYGTMFERDGHPVTPNIAQIAQGFGVHGVRVEQPQDIAPAVQKALALGAPAVVEVMIDMTHGASGGQGTGWWDVPVPGYLGKKHADYLKALAEVKL
ncbi:MAG: thiamine pyrophosphate-binding protein [Chloroflexi bacterium]|nr:thiamine pyrophosphate-binding protein [Chloroflexota bacterium]